MVQRSTGLAGLDRPLADWFVTHRQGVVTPLAWAVTASASATAVIAATVVLVAVLLVVRRGVGLAVLVAASTVVAAVTSALLKDLTARARPPVADLLGGPSSSAAFPSGHTTSGTVLAGSVVLVAAGLGASRRALRRAAAAAALLASAVGASRIYLGYHWFTDVVAGWVLGAGVVALASLWVLRTSSPPAMSDAATPPEAWPRRPLQGASSSPSATGSIGKVMRKTV